MPDPTDPDGRLDDASLAAALLECVGELDDDTRTAVLLRYQQGFTFEEIAQMCNEPPDTVHARVTAALPWLHECVETRTGGKV